MNKKITMLCAVCLLLGGLGKYCYAQGKLFELKYSREVVKKESARNIGPFTDMQDEVKKYVYEILGKEEILSFIKDNKDLCENYSLWKGPKTEPKDTLAVTITKTVTLKKDIVAGRNTYSRIGGPKYVETKIIGYAVALRSAKGQQRYTEILKTPLYLSSFSAYLKMELNNPRDPLFEYLKERAMSFRRLK